MLRHGFRRLVLLNGHGGNQSILAVAGEQIGQRWPEMECLVASWWGPAGESLKDLQEGPLGSVGHACEFETSIMLAIAPELVDMRSAEDGGNPASSRVDVVRHAARVGGYVLSSVRRAFGERSVRKTVAGVGGKRQSGSWTRPAAALHRLIADFWADTAELPG